MNLSSKTRLIFDFDDTIGLILIDWNGWRRGVGDIIRSFDPSFDIDLKGGRMGLRQNDFFTTYGKACRDKILAFSEEYELRHATGFRPDPNILKVIHDTTDKKMYVWSSNSRKIIERYLGELQIWHRFERIVSKDDVFFIKPHTEGFSLIHDGSHLNDYVFFGDSDADKGVAKNLGITYIDVKNL